MRTWEEHYGEPMPLCHMVEISTVVHLYGCHPCRGRLCSCTLTHCIYRYFTMSSSRNATASSSNSQIITLSKIPLFKGTNYLSWWPKMETYLIFTGCMWIANISEPTKPTSLSTPESIQGYIKWQESNGKLTSPILQTLLEALFEEYKVHTAYTDLIKTIQDDYAKPTLTTIFTDFKAILKTSLPNLGNPEPSIQQIESLFARMKNASYPVANNIQALILLTKIPSSLDTVTQIIVQAKVLRNSCPYTTYPTFSSHLTTH